jgi:hypothetical protein
MVQVEFKTLVQENISQGTKTSTSEVEQKHIIATDRPIRTFRPLASYGYEDIASYALVISSVDPTTFQGSVNGKEKSSWVCAME